MGYDRDEFACPDCGAQRVSPTAPCDACPYVPITWGPMDDAQAEGRIQRAQRAQRAQRVAPPPLDESCEACAAHLAAFPDGGGDEVDVCLTPDVLDLLELLHARSRQRQRRRLLRRVVTIAGVILLGLIVALGCGGLLVDARAADRAIVEVIRG